MNFVDGTLVRLADPNTRLAVIDNASLEQLVSAAYDTRLMPIQGPFAAVFDEFRLGLSVPNLGLLEGYWSPVGGTVSTEARFQISGISDAASIRVDALWRGSIVARTVPPNGQITAVQEAWPDASTIDADIVAALGALPASPAQLEQERRRRFLIYLQAAFGQPDLFADADLDRWLKEQGAASVGDLLTRFTGELHTGAVQLTFSTPAIVPDAPKQLPITIALLIRDAGFSVAQLLTDSKVVREQIDRQGVQRPADPNLKTRNTLVIAWIIPAAVFDDADWPGGVGGMAPAALRTARRTAAGQWLAQEGIGLIAV